MSSNSLPLFLDRSAVKASQQSDSARWEENVLQPSDNHLMESIQRGDRDALGLLFDRYSKLVFAVSARILRNSTEAQDLLQDVFLQVLHKCHQFDAHKGPVVSWLLRVTYSRAFDRREYLNIRGWSDYSKIELEDQTHIDSSLDVLAETVLAKQLLERASSELTRRQHLTLQMFFFEGYTLREISARLDESIINTRHHYYRGIERLRAVLSEPRKRTAASD